MWSIIIYDQNQQEILRKPIYPDQSAYVGGSPDNQIYIEDPTIPLQQFMVYLAEGYPVIENFETDTLLDGYAVEQPSYVTESSVVSFGGYNCYFIFEDSDQAVSGAGVADNYQAAPVTGGYTEDPPPPPPPPPPDEEFQHSAEQQAIVPGGGNMAGGQYSPVPQPQDSIPGQKPDDIILGSDAVPYVENRQLKLVAREGYLDNRQFVLAYDDFFDLGRSPDVEIVVDDPSISRVHARLKLDQGGTLVVQDLRSTNGTFINGKEVKREIASVGDRIRVGEIPFLLATDNYLGSDNCFQISDILKSRKIIFLVLGIFFIITGAVVVKMARQNKKEIPKKTMGKKNQYEKNLKARVAKLKNEAKELAKLDQWDAALSKYKSALAIVPEDEQLKELISQAEFERDNYRIFKKALSLKNQMTQESRKEALKKFRQINKNSRYYRSDLSPVIIELKKSMARFYRTNGLTEYKQRNYKKAFKNLCAYFELDSKLDNVEAEDEIRDKLKKVQRKLRYRKGKYKCKAKRFHNERVPISEMWAKNAVKEIKKKYYRGIGDAVVAYFVGNPKEAIDKLKGLTKTYGGRRRYRKHTSEITELLGHLRTIIQAYESGETKIRNNDIKGAKKSWDIVLKLDKKIFSGKHKSRYHRNIANRLSQKYYEEGKKALDIMRYEDAFKFFQKGMDLDPDDTTELRAGFKSLELKAMELYDEAVTYKQNGNKKLALEKARRVLAITPKDSQTRKKVLKEFDLEEK
ncbi:MAG: FHA domain-containing protein [Myxococcota bacterium]